MPFKDKTKAREYHRDYIRRYVADPEKRARRNKVANDRIRGVKDWLNAYKVEHGCVDCGYNEFPQALDIDHINGKTRNISSLKSIAAIEAEIARHDCVVRCANCHRVKSWAEKVGAVYQCKPDIFWLTYEKEDND